MKQKILMSSIIKHLLIIITVLSFNLSSAQEKNKDKTDFPVKPFQVMVSAGLYYPQAFGNNLASKDLSLNPGIHHAITGKLSEHNLLFGISYSGFRGKVKENVNIGSYDKSGINVFMTEVGYIFWEQQAWSAHVKGGFGLAYYYNKSNDFSFRDTGKSLAVSPTLTYRFHKNFAAYSTLSYRHDFLKTKTPSAVKSYFKNQDYLTLSLGITLLF